MIVHDYYEENRLNFEELLDDIDLQEEDLQSLSLHMMRRRLWIMYQTFVPPCLVVQNFTKCFRHPVQKIFVQIL